MQAKGVPPGTATPMVPISWGELIDKITILEIKREKVVDAGKRGNIEKELGLLQGVAGRAPDNATLSQLKHALRTVNEALWEVEDRIRDKEAAKQFDGEFVELARSVYRQNDKRAELKREINVLMGSALVEEKLYKSY